MKNNNDELCGQQDPIFHREQIMHKLKSINQINDELLDGREKIE